MNFFKSVFSDDPDPPKSDPTTPETQSHHEDRIDPDPDLNSSPAWSFGGLIKTLATKSESVIETYRRDLHEFGSGLKKEIEVAQGSLGTVGTAIDELGTSVLKGTAQIISHGKDAILADGQESDSSDANLSPSSKPYSRFEAQVRDLQVDRGTYCDEPEDSDDYVKWKLGFSLEDKKEEIERSAGENNGAIESIYRSLVPEMVDHESFWFRYFYKVQKLKQAKELRASLVKRAISAKEDEDLSWDVDEDDDDDDDDENKEAIVRLKLNSKENANDCDLGSKDDCESIKAIDRAKASEAFEEDLGWDEIEDLSAIDGNKASEAEDSPERAELRKRLGAADEDEDLSWDIEDDDDDDDDRKTKA